GAHVEQRIGHAQLHLHRLQARQSGFQLGGGVRHGKHESDALDATAGIGLSVTHSSPMGEFSMTSNPAVTHGRQRFDIELSREESCMQPPSRTSLVKGALALPLVAWLAGFGVPGYCLDR